jgi:anti-sigma factor RsiW
VTEQRHLESEASGAYVLDALSDDEAREFETHLRECAACRAEVAELQQVVNLLPLAVEPVEPPAGLRDRILSEARNGSTAPAITPFAGNRMRRADAWRARIREPMTWIGAAAAAVIIGLGVWNVTLQNQTHSSPPTSAVADALAHGARAWAVAGTAGAPAAAGSLVQPKQGGNAWLVVTGLPPSPANRVYQIWLMRGNSPTSGGTFTVSSSGTQVYHLIRPATGYQLTAVTSEPGPRGSRGPTTKPVLFGKLGA